MADTFGQFLLNEAIPKAYRPDGAYTKRKLQTQMTRLAKDDPTNYVNVITEVKRLGDEFATHEGVSVGLDDIAPLYAKRNAITLPALKAIRKAKTRKERQGIISGAQDQLIDYAMTHPGTMGDMARAGARGKALQLMRAVGAPAAASDEKDDLQPWLTVHSYSEGLRPSEWWATNREARMAAVKTNIEVTEPGDLSKILVNNTSHQVVIEVDCGSRNGLSFPVGDPNLLDRYLARAESSLKAGTLVTPRVLSQLKKQKLSSVLVRSPMTCESGPGLCQKCAGLDSTGKLNKIGDNLGIRASQSLGEPLTQLALDAKHGVRVSGGDKAHLSGLTGFRAILESPSSFKNKAILAPITGTVDAVDTAPQGGHFITMGTDTQHVGQGLEPIVKVGDKVYAGDALSDGVPRPDEVVKHKGLGAGRDYVVESLAGIYKNSGINVDRRHFEILAKSTLNHLRIEDIDDKDSAEHGLVRGDVIDYNRFRNIVASSIETLPVAKAEGKYLGEGVLHHLAGTQITAPMVKELQRANIRRVKITMNAPVVSPVMAPATRNPLLNPDWAVRLGHRYLKQTILEGAQKGQSSQVHGTHPVPGLIFSSEFGEGPAGRY
jgi:DNA-directed RNA polymerase subunit beta'